MWTGHSRSICSLPCRLIQISKICSGEGAMQQPRAFSSVTWSSTMPGISMLSNHRRIYLASITSDKAAVRWKHYDVDTSKVPILNEDDLEEWFVKGSGPGGQNVNKRTNCCSLKHKPTGVLVKCHLSRELEKNRKMARKMMIEKLDEFYNGDESVRAQKERINLKKSHTKENKTKKMLELKKKYKDLIHDDTDIISGSSKEEVQSTFAKMP